MVNYDITKELNDIKTRMYGTHLEQDRIVIEDAIKELAELKAIKEYINPLRNFNTHNEHLEKLKELIS